MTKRPATITLPDTVLWANGQEQNITPAVSNVVYPASAVYNGTKYAVRAIMEGLRQEEKNHGIRSTIVSPGAVRTELVNTIGNTQIQAGISELMNADDSKGLVLNPEDIANAVLFAIDQPKHVAISEVLVRPAQQEV
ncbi:SDR family oxidoreductase [Lactiplantibacillus pentosus]|uniref:SDR family oxidoreductase n=1 Tax=Lactiplantibacillus pentosus TaxID=1589 RepID=UPI003C1EE566